MKALSESLEKNLMAGYIVKMTELFEKRQIKN